MDLKTMTVTLYEHYRAPFIHSLPQASAHLRMEHRKSKNCQDVITVKMLLLLLPIEISYGLL